MKEKLPLFCDDGTVAGENCPSFVPPQLDKRGKQAIEDLATVNRAVREAGSSKIVVVYVEGIEGKCLLSRKRVPWGAPCSYGHLSF